MSDQQERKGTLYAFATIGACTERGGRVSTASKFRLCGLGIARVGDVVTYPDGSEAVIVDGAGSASTIDNRAAALVGSHLSNGDCIIETLWAELKTGIFLEEGTQIEGLFDPDWIAPPPELLHRFAVCGATTAKGGVIRKVSSDWEVPGILRNAAAVGDFVEYQDGSLARIVTGVGIAGSKRKPYAVVGSLIDNGDIITDSPDRDSQVSTAYVLVNEHGVAITRQ